jgi:hypothetical protein
LEQTDFRQLFTQAGQQALAAASALTPREQDFLSHFNSLGKQFEREIARAALTTAILRLEAQTKFPQASKMYFTREALEQATPWAVSSFRAKRFAGSKQIFDLGCSIGGDSLALAAAAPVTAIERDGLRAAMAQANAQASGANVRVIQADIKVLPFSLGELKNTAVFFDPARRENGRRAFSVEKYSPPLSTIQSWLPHLEGLAIKVSPGVELAELSEYDCEIEFVSLDGDLKEALLWFGRFKGPHFRATLIRADGSVETMTRDKDSPKLAVAEPRRFLYEPDPAILRAGLVTHLGQELDAAQLDAEIAYLTSDTYRETPFARAWAVEDWLPFQLKNLRAYLRERNVGRVTVKKRGSPITPEQIIQELRLRGTVEKVLFLTQQAGKPIVVVARPN